MSARRCLKVRCRLWLAPLSWVTVSIFHNLAGNRPPPRPSCFAPITRNSVLSPQLQLSCPLCAYFLQFFSYRPHFYFFPFIFLLLLFSLMYFSCFIPTGSFFLQSFCWSLLVVLWLSAAVYRIGFIMNSFMLERGINNENVGQFTNI